LVDAVIGKKKKKKKILFENRVEATHIINVFVFEVDSVDDDVICEKEEKKKKNI
jgi:hypothetical protein